MGKLIKRTNEELLAERDALQARAGVLEEKLRRESPEAELQYAGLNRKLQFIRGQ